MGLLMALSFSSCSYFKGHQRDVATVHDVSESCKVVKHSKDNVYQVSVAGKHYLNDWVKKSEAQNLMHRFKSTGTCI